jgi:hypothetical protein
MAYKGTRMMIDLVVTFDGKQEELSFCIIVEGKSLQWQMPGRENKEETEKKPWLRHSYKTTPVKPWLN